MSLLWKQHVYFTFVTSLCCLLLGDRDYDNGTEEAVAESMKEEKRRKQMEAVAEEMFNNERVS